VIDEGQDQPRRSTPPQRALPRWEALSPMPLAGPQMEGLERGMDMDLDLEEQEHQSPDDFFSERFLPSRQAGEDGKLKELPRFVPLQCDLFSTIGDPWSVHSVGDLLRLYLPEISISTAVVVACGMIAGRLVSRFAGGELGPEVLVTYLALQALCVALVYVCAKGSSCTRVRGWMRKHLLGSLLFLGGHLLAYGLLVAGR
jgi:hypothetical protein